MEVGAAAGLLLRPDRNHYIYRRGSEVSELGSGASIVRLGCEIRRNAAVPTRLPNVVWRAGLDLEPLSAANEDGARWLDCSVFPEQSHRREQLAAAISEAQADPPIVHLGSLVDDLADLAARAPQQATLVVLHAALLPHLDAGRQREFLDLVDSLGAVRLGMEASDSMAALGTGRPSESLSRRRFWVTVGSDVVVAADPFGHWIDDLSTS